MEPILKKLKPRKTNSVLNGLRISILAGLFLFAGCAHTIAPIEIKAQKASYSGDTRDSGLKFNAPKAQEFDPHSRDRYNALIDVYGSRFTPPLKHDDGLTLDSKSGLWTIDNEHLEKAVQMNLWRKAGQ